MCILLQTILVGSISQSYLLPCFLAIKISQLMPGGDQYSSRSRRMSEFQRAIARRAIANVTAIGALIFYVDFHAKNFGDTLCPQHLAWRAESNEISLIHHRDTIAEHRRVVQIVQSCHDRELLAADEIKQSDLVPASR
jgi:hypothetical protein